VIYPESAMTFRLDRAIDVDTSHSPQAFRYADAQDYGGQAPPSYSRYNSAPPPAPAYPVAPAYPPAYAPYPAYAYPAYGYAYPGFSVYVGPGYYRGYYRGGYYYRGGHH